MKKKWWIFIIILAIVAVVLTIVFINLFKERDTKALSEKIYSVSQTGYLSPDSEENKVIDEYLTNLKTLGGNFSPDNPDADAKEIVKISNYLQAYASFEVSIKFFSREMVFAKASETYINNRKKVENCLNDAQKLADELEKHINDSDETDGSAWWEARTWADCHEKMTKMINKTAEAMNLLADIYQKSVPSVVEGKGFLNNDFTSIILDEMKTLTKNITEKADQDVNYGSDLYVFVDAYLDVRNEQHLLNYRYNEELQNKVKDIKEKGEDSEFFPIFVEGNLV